MAFQASFIITNAMVDVGIAGKCAKSAIVVAVSVTGCGNVQYVVVGLKVQ